MRAKRTDHNQIAVIAAFRKLGFSVSDTSSVGNGFPDLCIGKADKNMLVEIKDGKKAPSRQALTPAQVRWHKEWQGGVCLVRSLDDVVNIGLNWYDH